MHLEKTKHMRLCSFFTMITFLLAILPLFSVGCGGGSGSGSGSDNQIPSENSLQDFPRIQISYPPRGATILGTPSDPAVEVTGNVTGGAGQVASLTINNISVSLDASGNFTYTMPAAVGGNAIVLEARNDQGLSSRQVQAFTWSTGYKKFVDTADMTQSADPAAAVWLGQPAIDDGDHSLPPDDLATVLEVSLASIDFRSYFSPDIPIATRLDAGSGCTYNLYISDHISWNPLTASMTAIDGGISTVSSMTGVRGDLSAIRTNNSFSCAIAYPQSIVGAFTIDSIQFPGAYLLGTTPDNQLAVTFANGEAAMTSPEITGPFNSLLDPVVSSLSDYMAMAMEAELTYVMTNSFGSVLQGALDNLAPGLPVDFPRLDGSSGNVSVESVADFSRVDPVSSSGIEFAIRMGAYADSVIPYDNLGIPEHADCGLGSQTLTMPRYSDVELGIADDAVNQQLYAQWRAGRFEFDVPASALDTAGYSFSDLSITVSGLLAPVVSECNALGEIRVFVGDLRLDISLTTDGIPIDAVGWVVLECDVDVSTAGSYLALSTGALQSLEVQLNMLQDEGVAVHNELQAFLEDHLTNGFVTDLAASAFAYMPVPVLNMSTILPEVTLAMTPGDIIRNDGSTITDGTF